MNFNEEILKMNNGKKFDVVLMNPPYAGSLHLKFLEKVIEISNKVVSIQPIRWLEDKTGKFNKKSGYNKYKESIVDHIKDLEVITMRESQNLFDVWFNFNLGIYVCDKNGGFNVSQLNENSILSKVLKKMKSSLKEHIEFSKPINAVVISLINGGGDGRGEFVYNLLGDDYEKVIYDKDGKRLDNGLSFYENRKKTAWGNVKIREEQNNIKFHNINECINFVKFTNTYLFRYIFNQSMVDVHVHPDYLPFMENYSKEWTDEELFKYFDINNKEQEEIKKVVNNCINKTKEYYSQKKKRNK